MTNDRLAQMPIEFHLVAVDVLTGEELLLSRRSAARSGPGERGHSRLAWRRLPGDGGVVMDRGVANNTPISHAGALRARTVHVPPTGLRALEQPPESALERALHALTLLAQSRLSADVESHRDLASLVVVSPPCSLATQPIDLAHAEELVERSLRTRERASKVAVPSAR